MKSLVALPIKDVLDITNSRQEGLSSTEAAKRLQEYGPNAIPHHKIHSNLSRFFGYLRDGFSLLLIFASILAFLSIMIEVGCVILGIVLMNAGLSLLQEVRAEKAMEALKGWIPEWAKIIRDNRLQKAAVQDVVPGDVIVLEEGDRVPADARLVDAQDLWINNIPLTGEAEPQPRTAEAAIDPNIPYQEAPNLVFMSTSVIRGRGTAVVFATGLRTKFGELANLAQDIQDPTSPLEIEISKTAKVDFIFALLIGVLFFIISQVFLHLPIDVGILFMIGVMVCLVPEGLQLTVSTALGINVLQMARHNVLVKRFSAVQTLGSITLIATDKTGTITKGEMTVRKLFTGDQIYDVSGVGYRPEGMVTLGKNKVVQGKNPNVDKLLEIGILCNRAKLEPPTSEQQGKAWNVIGDPMEGSLLIAAMKYGMNVLAMQRNMPVSFWLPFDPKRKRATTLHRFNHQIRVFMKGAPFNVFPVCTKVLINGNPVTLTSQYLQDIEKLYRELAGDGLRLIACAYREIPESEFEEGKDVEHDMILVGLIAMYDPPRLEVKNAVRIAKQAGIEIIIITGDSGYTTEAIATEVGIINGKVERLIRGRDIDNMTDVEIVESVRNGHVIFARVTPEQKFRIVRSIKEAGEIVAVTGDGVNDAPSLKEANIGIAMGNSGTDLARENSDMVLLDDSFASIVKGIESGRVIFENIRRFIVYVFTHNWAELIPYLLYVILGIPLPLLVMQILAIDLFIDIIPSLAIGQEPPEPGIMNEPPRSTREHLFDVKSLLRSFYVGGIISIGAIWGCLNAWIAGGWQIGMPLDSSSPLYFYGTTMTFAGIAMGQVGNVLSCRTSKTSIFRVNIFRNKWILIGIGAQILILLIFIYVPWLQPIFGTRELLGSDWIFLLLITGSVIGAEELRKALTRKIRN